MDTKLRILEEALQLFADQGYEAVTVAKIAERVGIRAPSLYKHFKSKQEIFSSILEEMEKRYEAQAQAMQLQGNDPDQDALHFSKGSLEMLLKTTEGFFLFFLHDPWISRFRRLLTVEQYYRGDLAVLYTKLYYEGPLAYQKALFENLMQAGKLKRGDPEVMAFQFYGPVYLLLTQCDRQPEGEQAALKKLRQHTENFDRLYGLEEEKK